MFEYLEPDAAGASNLPPDPGDGSLPVPPNTGSPGGGIRSLRPERLRHLLYGSRAAIDRTIKILHAYGYADPNDWSDPIPVPPSGTGPQASSGGEGAAPEGVTWMVILTKTLLLE
jgi:hypothetical protein